MKKLLLLLVLSSFLTGFASADFKAGMIAFEAGDYEAAYKELLPIAELGNKEAGDFIGVMYLTGTGVKKDLVQAYKWFQISAANDSEMDNDLLKEIGSKLKANQVFSALEMVEDWKKNHR